MDFRKCTLLFVICLLIGIDTRSGDPVKKVSSLGIYQGYTTKNYGGYTYQSQYIKMPDSVHLAIDVFLPRKRLEEEAFPTIIYFVRYGRSLQFRKILGMNKKPIKGAHVSHQEVDFFTSNGYACVIVDLRGSGASFGYRKMEFSDEEVKDMTQVMDWVTKQSWSDQKLATTGVSYTGTTAVFALSTKHPNLKACIPRSSIFDLYEDVLFPGGIRQTPFIQCWKETTLALDNNDFSIFGTLAKTLVKGINPVEMDKRGTLLTKAVQDHQKNFDIFTGILTLESRDDIEPITQKTPDDYSIHKRMQEVIDSNVPIYRISGWYDGANIQSAIKGTLNMPNTKRLLIGPWDHGPDDRISPFDKKAKVQFSIYTEMLRFLDFHVKGIPNGINEEARIHYYQMGLEEFKATDHWPLKKAEEQFFYLSSENELKRLSTHVKKGSVTYNCDYTVASTTSSRWNSLTPLYKNGKTRYRDRREVNKKMLLFQSEPVTSNMEITGHPEVDLFISVDARDIHLFVYLEDVSPEGHVTYITEGMLRGAFRSEATTTSLERVGPHHSFLKKDKRAIIPQEVIRMRIGLLPISYLLQEGHRLQLSIAVSDTNHFDLPNEKAKQLNVYFSDQYSSLLKIPAL